MEFSNKTVVITGAASGIGRALLRGFIEKGSFVIGIDLNEVELAKIKNKYPSSCEVMQADVTDLEQLQECADRATSGRKIDIWINNAGIAGIGSFEDQSLETFKKVLDINLWGVVYGTRVAMKAMGSEKGKIVNMASVAGLLPAPMMSAYCASKHGVVGFSRALSQELQLKKSNISIATVCPGFVETAIIKKGEKMGFPNWMTFMLSTPETVVDEIFKGLIKDRTDIYPTFNGNLMRRMHRFFPGTTLSSSKVMFAKSWKHALLNRYEASDFDR